MRPDRPARRPTTCIGPIYWSGGGSAAACCRAVPAAIGARDRPCRLALLRLSRLSCHAAASPAARFCLEARRRLVMDRLGLASAIAADDATSSARERPMVVRILIRLRLHAVAQSAAERPTRGKGAVSHDGKAGAVPSRIGCRGARVWRWAGSTSLVSYFSDCQPARGMKYIARAPSQQDDLTLSYTKSCNEK